MGRAGRKVPYCDINRLFLSLFFPQSSTPCNSDTLLQHKHSSQTVSKCQQRYFYHTQRHRFIFLYRHNLDTNSPTHLISSFQTTQSITDLRRKGLVWFDFVPNPWPNHCTLDLMGGPISFISWRSCSVASCGCVVLMTIFRHLDIRKYSSVTFQSGVESST